MLRRGLTLLVLGLTIVPPAAAAAAPRGAVSPFSASIPVHLTAQGRVLAPARVTPGDQLIANHSTQELILVARRTLGARRLVADLRRDHGPILTGTLTRDFTVVDTLTPGAHSYTIMRPGTYLIAELHAPSQTAADVATVQVAGSGRGVPVPVGASVVRFTKNNHVAVPDPVYAMSALYIRNAGTRAVQIRLYRVAADVRATRLAGFTAHPSWSGLHQLHITHANDLATLAPGRWITNGDLPANGRYVVVAVPLVPGDTHVPALRPAWVAATHVRS